MLAEVLYEGFFEEVLLGLFQFFILWDECVVEGEVEGGLSDVG